jgi:hypothetical protein
MLMPDVTSILYDPEVGGGQTFTVTRNTSVRKRGGYEKTPTVTTAVGNVQPQEMSNQTSTSEDLLNESIVIYSTFCFQTGSNSGASIVEADVVFWNDLYWRVTNVEDWSKWGYTKANATRIRDLIPAPQQEETVVEG